MSKSTVKIQNTKYKIRNTKYKNTPNTNTIDDDANYQIGKESLVGHVGCFGDNDIYEHVKYTQMSSDRKSDSRQANTIHSKIVGNDNIHVIAIFVAICLISVLYCFVCRRKNKQDEVNFSILENESDRFLDSKNENYGTYL